MNKALETYNKLKNDDEVILIKDALKNDGKLTKAYSIGYRIFDSIMIGGVRAGDLVISQGISGHGKTTYMQNICVNLSKQSYPSLFLTYEVVIDNLYFKFMQMGLTDNDLLIYTPKNLTSGNLTWVEQKILEAKEKFGIKFIFLDHLDALIPAEIHKSDTDNTFLMRIANELKQMALKHEVIIFLVCHVNKIRGKMIGMMDSAGAAVYKPADFQFGIQRSVEKIDIHGIETEVDGNVGIVRMLKNRLTGSKTYMDYELINNVIVPLNSSSYNKETKEKEDIKISDDKIGTVNIDQMFS